MNRNKFEKRTVNEHPYLPKSYDFPMFKSGDIIWVLDEQTYREFSNNKYDIRKAIVLEGPDDDDGYCNNWRYKVVNMDIYENKELDDEQVEYSTYWSEQIYLFHKLSTLKKAVEGKCDIRIQELKDKITKVQEQNSFIQGQVDVQERREEQIDTVLDK